MPRSTSLRLLLALAALPFAAPASDSDALDGATRLPGFVDVWRDQAGGRVLIGVRELDAPLLLTTALPGGLGANEVLLDRGQTGEGRLVSFRRVGKRLALIAHNTAFVARSRDEAERRAAEGAFAVSVLWTGEVLAERDGATIVDFGSFLASDRHGIAARLEATGQGAHRLDADRSLVLPASARSFADNAEFDALLTFSGDGRGEALARVVPDPASVTLRQRVSLVRLPPDGFRARAWHPASGAFFVESLDFARPLSEPLTVRWQPRFRLQKTNPGAARSAVVEPIVFHLDPGTPEPVRSALLEGARWWAEAFEAAGFVDAFRVELLPPGLDPQDIHVNPITWTHRATRGWSYGGVVVDPRTGEILKGMVNLGSQRVRQDMLIAEALTAPFADGADPELAAQAERLALARLRQLSAHEVGHALGFAHNFAASLGGNGSVLDYPHPVLRRGADGGIDLSDPYGVGIGPWDRFIVRHGYGEFAPGEEAGALAALRRGIREAGIDYVADGDARAPSSAHPKGALWDFGADPLASFAEVMALRATALERFGPGVLPRGRPAGELAARLVPVYLLHRYQAEAVAHLLGGASYRYGVAGEDVFATVPVEGALQRRALDALGLALDVDALALPEDLRAMLVPPGADLARDREHFTTRMAPLSDPLAAAEAATAVVARLLFEPARVNRLALQAADDAAVPMPGSLVAMVEARWLEQHRADSHAALVAAARNRVLLEALLGLLAGDGLHAAPAAAMATRLGAMAKRLEAMDGRGDADAAARRIRTFLADPASVTPRPLPEVPPGAPI